MRIYQLHTNEGVRYVRSTDARLRAAMFAYIREKRATGYPMADIIYCWSPLSIGTV